MPQFDLSILLLQVSWLIIIFLFFYLVITYFFLPVIFNLIRIRFLKKQECKSQNTNIQLKLLDSNLKFISYFLNINKYHNLFEFKKLNTNYELNQHNLNIKKSLLSDLRVVFLIELKTLSTKFFYPTLDLNHWFITKIKNS